MPGESFVSLCFMYHKCATFAGDGSAPERFMSTTTIRLSEDLKARIAAAAKQAGTTSHNFILEAISEKADLAERRADFDAAAEQRYARIVESGKTVSWDDMRGYLEDRIAGRAARRPAARKLAK
jgi:Ribbon-helix-helix protein, copG family.